MKAGASAVTNSQQRVFLTAEWRDLVMLNYAVDPALVQHLVPSCTELDCFEGKSYISLVGFRFLQTRLLGIPIPFHQDFEEVNLRFYVRRESGEGVRRGVVFIREIVPKRAVAATARFAFNENYVRLPMCHRIESSQVEYGWQLKESWNYIRIEMEGNGFYPENNSAEQFITEHYWGYARQRDSGCLEYQVQHAPWRVWNARAAAFEGDASPLYGPEFARILARDPESAFRAEGSPVTVFRGHRLFPGLTS